MSQDPLILEFLRLLKEDEAKELEALAITMFNDLYNVGLCQGRIQGIKIARLALDAAARDVEE